MTQQMRDLKFRREMIQYIKDNFAHLLGEHARLLDEEGGLDALQAMIREGRIGKGV